MLGARGHAQPATAKSTTGLSVGGALRSPPLAQLLNELEGDPLLDPPFTTATLELHSVVPTTAPPPLGRAAAGPGPDGAGPPLLRVTLDRHKDENFFVFFAGVRGKLWDMLELLRTRLEPGPGLKL
jgi:hypothetical protein